MTVKRNGNLIITKGGKVSCTCCKVECCPPRFYHIQSRNALRNSLILINDYSWRSRFPEYIWPEGEGGYDWVHFSGYCCRSYEYNRISQGSYSLIKKTRPITTNPGYIVVQSTIEHWHDFSNSEIDSACSVFGVNTTDLGIVTITVLWGRYFIRQRQPNNTKTNVVLGSEENDSIGGIQCVKFNPS